MKRILTLFFLSYSLLSYAQIFEVDTIWKSGPIDDRINFVVLGDGYQEHEIPMFIAHTHQFTHKLFNETPFKQYKNFFNLFAIKVISNESGASHPGTAVDVPEPVHPISQVDNYFGSSFDAAGIHRLLIPTKRSKVASVLAQNFPLYDHGIIIVNTDHYGGSGGTYATTSASVNFGEIAIHELGHSFANLVDEYYIGGNYNSEAINLTQENDPDKVKWKLWMNDNGIGLYPHCCGGNSRNWYRPHQNCKMRFLGHPFCSVCSQAFIKKIYELVNVIESYEPNELAFDLSEQTSFSIQTIDPMPNTLNVEWRFNGEVIHTGNNAVTFSENDLTSGENQLMAYVIDNTSLIRVESSETFHISVISWNLNGENSSIDNITEEQFQLELFPNPTQDILYFNHNLASDYQVIITDIVGQEIMKESFNQNQNEEQLSLRRLSKGVYFANFYFDNGIVVSKKILKR